MYEFGAKKTSGTTLLRVRSETLGRFEGVQRSSRVHPGGWRPDPWDGWCCFDAETQKGQWIRMVNIPVPWFVLLWKQSFSKCISWSETSRLKGAVCVFFNVLCVFNFLWRTSYACTWLRGRLPYFLWLQDGTLISRNFSRVARSGLRNMSQWTWKKYTTYHKICPRRGFTWFYP